MNFEEFSDLFYNEDNTYTKPQLIAILSHNFITERNIFHKNNYVANLNVNTGTSTSSSNSNSSGNTTGGMFQYCSYALTVHCTT